MYTQPKNKQFDWSYLLLLPFLAITWIPILALYWRMRYTYILAIVWLIIATLQRRQVRLPQKGISSLIGAMSFLIMYSSLGVVYNLFGIGLALTFESVAGLLQTFVPLAIFHLSLCNGRQRELRLLVFYCFGCLIVGAIMTYLGEYEIVGGSRALTGSTNDAHDAYMLGVGAYGFVYGTGLLVVPLLYVLTFMPLRLKILFSALIVVILIAVFRAGYSILIISMAMACTLYVVAKLGFRKRRFNLMGFSMVAMLVMATAVPTILSFMSEPIRKMRDLTTNAEYQNRIVSVADAVSGADGTYTEMRASLYWNSWRVFLKYPLFGGGTGDTRRPALDVVGGHSTIFDTLGFYGLFGMTIYLLFFMFHYRYLRVMSDIVLGYQWWPSYTIFLFSAVAVMFINPLSGPPLLYNLCLFIPTLPLLFKNMQRRVGHQIVPTYPHHSNQREARWNV